MTEPDQHPELISLREGLSALDKRVSILEVKTESNRDYAVQLADELKRLRDDIRTMAARLNEGVSKVRAELHAHVVQEDRDRLAMLRWLIGQMLLIGITFLTVAAPHVVDYLTGAQ